MEFRFDLSACVGAPPDHKGPCVGYIDERVLSKAGSGRLATVLEEMGQRSAVAQGLRKPVTYGCGLGDQRVYLLVDGRQALGFLKVGTKRLFISAGPAASGPAQAFPDVQAAFREIEPLCVLDFYVHESHQRFGHGKRLFESMLARESIVPARLAYDRPSPKLLSFLKRHCGLSKYLPQSNNFVVFDSYFKPGVENASFADSPRPRGSQRRTGGAAAGDGQGEAFGSPYGDSSYGGSPYAKDLPVVRRPNQPSPASGASRTGGCNGSPASGLGGSPALDGGSRREPGSRDRDQDGVRLEQHTARHRSRTDLFTGGDLFDRGAAFDIGQSPGSGSGHRNGHGAAAGDHSYRGHHRGGIPAGGNTTAAGGYRGGGSPLF